MNTCKRIFDELRHKPFDRALLDRFEEQVRHRGLACDLGCGPGHIARYLQEQGVSVCGIDLSAEMVERARRLTPGVEFRQGDMRALSEPDESFAGIVAFYSIIHIPPDDVALTLRGLRRVLQPNGWLLLAFHIGSDAIHLDEWWGHEVDVDVFLFQPDEMASYVSSPVSRLKKSSSASLIRRLSIKVVEPTFSRDLWRHEVRHRRMRAISAAAGSHSFSASKLLSSGSAIVAYCCRVCGKLAEAARARDKCREWRPCAYFVRTIINSS